MTERDELILKAIDFWENSEIECCYSDAELANVTELMADFALSVQQKPVKWDILWNRFVKMHQGSSVSEIDVFIWIKEQPEFKSSEPPRKEEVK